MRSSRTWAAVSSSCWGAADELEQQLHAAAGQGDREPAHEAEVDVVLDLEPEVRGVEVERLVLVEDGELLMRTEVMWLWS